MKNIKKALCIIFSLMMVFGTMAVSANAESAELYHLVILEDNKFTRELANTALTAADVADAVTRNTICQYLDIKGTFPGVLASDLTKEKADAAVAALKEAGYNNCAAAKAKMGENITWTMKDAKITLSGTGETYTFDDYQNKTPLDFLNRWEIDKNGTVVKDNGGKNKSIMGNTTAFSIEVGEGITALGKYTFRYVAISNGDSTASSIGPSVTLPSTLTSIAGDAFAHSDTVSVNIPESVTFIGTSAFWDTKLGSVTIPKNAKLEGNPFANAGVTAFSLDAANPYYCLQDGILYSKDGKTLIAYPEQKVSSKVTVPNGVKALGRYAFYGAKVTTVVLPKSVETIGENCFYSSTLQEIYITSGLKTIEKSAFSTATYGIDLVSYNYFTTVYYEKGTDLDAITVAAGNGNNPYRNAEKIEAASYPAYTTCMVSFDCGNADSAPAFVTVNKGAKVAKPADPTDAGNQFLGWYKDSGCTTAFDFNQPINDNTTVYAKWKNSTGKTAVKIKLDTLYAKTEYSKGEAFSADGLTVTVTYSDGTTETVGSGFTVSTPNMQSLGQQTVNVIFGGCSANYYITVKDSSTNPDVPGKIETVTLPEKTSPFKNYVVVEVNCSDADKVKVNGTEYPVSGGKAVVNLQQLLDNKTLTIEAYKNGELKKSATGTITVPHGFFDKLSAFFRYVFGGFKYKTTTVSYTL